MWRIFSGVLFGIVALSLIACAGAPYREIKSAIAPVAADTSRLVFFRESNRFGGAVTLAVAIDGQTVGSVASGSVLTVDHAPGDLSLSAAASVLGFSQGTVAMTLQARPGQEYFIEFGLTPDCGAYQAPADFEKQTECLARSGVPRTARDGDACDTKWCMGLRDAKDALPRLDSLGVETPAAE